MLPFSITWPRHFHDAEEYRRIEAIDAVNDGEFGIMVALQGSDIVRVPIEDGVRELKTLDRQLYDVASVFFG